MNHLLLDALLKASHCASSDKYRFNLSHVKILRELNTLTLTACDGYKLVSIKVTDESFSELPEVCFWLADKDSIKSLKAILKNRIQLNLTHKETFIEIRSGTHILVLDKNAIEYPNTSVFRANRQGHHVISLNIEYLQNLVDSLKESKRDVICLSMPQNYIEPITVFIEENEDNYGIIMPCKMGVRK